MKGLLKVFTFIRNLIGLLFVMVYLIFVTVNLITNKGHLYVNWALFITALIYSGLYFYSSFIINNKKVKKVSKKVYVYSKKFIGIFNAFIIIASVATNDYTSYVSVILSFITIGLYTSYLVSKFIVFIITSILKRMARKISQRRNNRKKIKQNNDVIDV